MHKQSTQTGALQGHKQGAGRLGGNFPQEEGGLPIKRSPMIPVAAATRVIEASPMGGESRGRGNQQDLPGKPRTVWLAAMVNAGNLNLRF